MTLNILITGASGRIAYSLIPMIGLGHSFGSEQVLNIRLFDLPGRLTVLEGMKMEIEDSNFVLFNSVTVTSEHEVAFKDADIVICLASSHGHVGMSRSDFLKRNKEIFKQQAEYLEKFAKKDVKVLVVSNPANTNALIFSAFALSIPAKNITSLMRLDHNRLTHIVSKLSQISPSDIKNLVVWGNHSNSQYPSIEHVSFGGLTASMQEDLTTSLIEDEIIPAVKGRGKEIIRLLGASNALSASVAISEHLHDWFLGSGKFYISMGVCSDGSYDIPHGLVFGLPVKCLGNFEYKIVENLELSENLRKNIKNSIKELLFERECAFG